MPAGIQVFNTANTLQVDETYRNLLLVYSGQFTASQAAANADAWWQNFYSVWARLTPQAIMAVRTTTYPGLNLNIGSYRGGVKVCNFSFRRDFGPIPFQFYVFDNVNPVPSNVGMQVFNAAGQLVYDANDYPLKLIASVDTFYEGGTVVYTAPTTEVAYATTGGGYSFSAGGGVTEEKRAYTWWQGTQLNQQEFDNTHSQGGDPNGNYGRQYQSGIIVDVSNIPLNFTRG